MEESHKEHREPKSGRKKEKKDQKKVRGQDKEKSKQISRLNNPKAFTTASPHAAQMKLRRKADLSGKKLHIPKVNKDAISDQIPPAIVAVVGPPKVSFLPFLVIFFPFYLRLERQL
jgi:hypothetical protein